MPNLFIKKHFVRAIFYKFLPKQQAPINEFDLEYLEKMNDRLTI